MPDIQKVSIALTSEQVQSLKQAVSVGEYATTSEAVRDALREWQWKRSLRNEELNRLRSQWKEGKASGSPGPVSFDAIRTNAARRLKKAGSRIA